MLIKSHISPAYLLAALATVTLFIYYRSFLKSEVSSVALSHHATRPANETLGFAALYVVSGPGSPRRAGLVANANVTELELTIPDQVRWSDEEVQHFRFDNSSIMLNGSIKAWLSHRLVLQAFLDSGLETALIFEDDIDWDIRIRTTQVPLAAAAARALLSSSSVITSRSSDSYWGDTAQWDLLYIGHCGDYFRSIDSGIGVGYSRPSDLEAYRHIIYTDPSLPDWTDLHPFTVSLFAALGIPQQKRVLHKSAFPLCSFAYAVTRHMAQRLLTELALAKELPNDRQRAFDIALLHACLRDDVRCFTLNPEIFHHVEGESLIAGQNADVVGIPPVDKAAAEQVRYRKETPNIGCGFWSKDFDWKGDLKMLQYFREEVSRKGICLKPGRH
ncbi:hypothetical protein LTR66_014204 [Elasticomyces elasticus]|nr:hypothetical protein LTR66_014204 [Elasticomyces elasticus]